MRFIRMQMTFDDVSLCKMKIEFVKVRDPIIFHREENFTRKRKQKPWKLNFIGQQYALAHVLHCLIGVSN